ncbi:hypothetical protein AB0A69_22295 [Streptomyces sp. NPDC045431]|uniref:hypothetical protein n=1 Tax=Streptomyces sp. NPDC045431 TaxID=3155613 RepID=UPI0034105CCD
MRYDEVVPDATSHWRAPAIRVSSCTNGPPPTSPTAVCVFNHRDGSTTWRDAEDLRPTVTLPILPVLREVPDGKGRKHVFRHGGEEYRTRGSGTTVPDHGGRSTPRRTGGAWGYSTTSRTRRSSGAVASMVTAVWIISGDRPVHYIADAGNRLGDELRLDVPTADEQGRIREESEEDVMRRLTSVTRGVRRLRTDDEHRETIAFLRVYPVFTDGCIGQPQFAPL